VLDLVSSTGSANPQCARRSGVSQGGTGCCKERSQVKAHVESMELEVVGQRGQSLVINPVGKKRMGVLQEKRTTASRFS
jgi:hypothetical protein